MITGSIFCNKYEQVEIYPIICNYRIFNPPPQFNRSHPAWNRSYCGGSTHHVPCCSYRSDAIKRRVRQNVTFRRVRIESNDNPKICPRHNSRRRNRIPPVTPVRPDVQPPAVLTGAPGCEHPHSAALGSRSNPSRITYHRHNPPPYYGSFAYRMQWSFSVPSLK